MSTATFVVPCFNEQARLDADRFLAFVERGTASLLFVDDGSTDGTFEALSRLHARAPRGVRVLRLETNVGKAEAVRRGMILALEGGACIVGYLDADLSTPLDEASRLLRRLQASRHAAVLGARVALLGSSVERKTHRHVFGRVFATAAALVLGLRVYDTQCGAKFFRRSPLLVDCLAQPFHSRWAFDVELLGRLLTGSAACPPLDAADILEVPLRRWHDVEGSKLSAVAMLSTALELVVISASLQRRRRDAWRALAAPPVVVPATVHPARAEERKSAA